LNDNQRVTGNDSGNVLIANNLILSGAPDARLAFTNGGHDVVFRHNTFFNPWALVDGSKPLTGLSMVDNIMNNGQYGLSCFYGDNERSTCWPGYNLSTNVIIDNQGVAGLAGSYPGNFIAANQAAVQFVDAAGGNFGLADTSPYKGMASDGTDPGIDQDALTSALAGTRTPGPSGTQTPGPSDGLTPGPSGASDAPMPGPSPHTDASTL
jgi:hypothetical protein